MKQQHSLILIALATLAFAMWGCSSPTPADTKINDAQMQQQLADVQPAEKANPVRDHGYALLYDLMKNESQVGGILKIKSVSPPVEKAIKDIQAASKSALDVIEKLNPKSAQAKDDSKNQKLTVTALPEAEVKTRSSIQMATTAQLLMASGDKFQKRLLLTQVEATNYASHLAKIIGQAEDRSQAQQAMKQISERFSELHKQVQEMLVIAPADTIDNQKSDKKQSDDKANKTSGEKNDS